MSSTSTASVERTTGRFERPKWHTSEVPGNSIPPPSVYAASSLSPYKKNGQPQVSSGPPPNGVSQKEWDQYMNTINSAQKKRGAKLKNKSPVTPTPTSTLTPATAETTKAATQTQKKVHVPPKPEGTSQAEWNCYLQMVTQAKNISSGLSSDTYVDETNLVTLSTLASRKPREMLSAAEQSKGLSTPAVEFENARNRLKMAEMVKQSELQAKQPLERQNGLQLETSPLTTIPPTPTSTSISTPCITTTTTDTTTDNTNTTDNTATDSTDTDNNNTDNVTDTINDSKSKHNTNPFTGVPTTHTVTSDAIATEDNTPSPTTTTTTTPTTTTTTNANTNTDTDITDVMDRLTSPRGKNASELRRERNKKKQKGALPLQNGATSADDEWLFGTQSLRLKPWEIPSIEKEKVEVEKSLFPTVEHPVEVEAAAPVAVVFQPTEIELDEIEMQVVELEGDDQLFPGGEGIF